MNDGNLLTLGRALEIARHATLTLQGLEFRARVGGDEGNDITVAYTVGSALAITVTESAIAITIEADTTIQQIVNLVRETVAANALVDVEVLSPANTVAAAVPATSLAGGDSYTYALVQSISVNRPTREYKAYDGNGQPAARRQVADFATANATIVGVVGAMVPKEGDTFAYGDHNYVLASVEEGNEGEQPVIWTIQATQLYNS